MAQQARRMVEEHEIEAVARNDAAQLVEKQCERRACLTGGGRADLNRHVDVALRALPTVGAGAEQVGKFDLGKRGQSRSEPGGEGSVSRCHEAKATIEGRCP